jgi:hypothetical protein
LTLGDSIDFIAVDANDVVYRVLYGIKGAMME